MGLFERVGSAFTLGVTDAVSGVSRAAALRLPGLIGALLVVVIAWLAGRLVYAGVRRVLARTSTEGHVDVLVARFARGTVLAVGVVIALAVAGLDVGSLVTSLGLAGLTLGFALRDVLANSVAGVTLLIQRPFRIGDTIVVAGTEGVVIDVRVRDTVLRTPDGRVAYVPNTTVFNGVVLNSSAEPVRRFEIAVWTPAGADPDAARLRVLSAVQGVPGVQSAPAPEALVASLGPERARIVARAWVATAEAPLAATQSAALTAAHAALGSRDADAESCDAGSVTLEPASEGTPCSDE